MIIKELFAKIGLDIDEASFEAAKAILEGVKGSMVALVGGAAAVGLGLLEMGRETTNTAFEASKLADKLGVSTDAAQELSYAAETTGASAQSLESAMFHMSRTIETAAEGSMQARYSLNQLGIPLDSLRRMKPDEQFTRLAGALSKVKDQSRKAEIEQQIFGRGARELNPLFAEGEEGIRRYREEAQEMGLVLSEDTIKEAKEWRLEMRHGAEQIDALKFRVGAFVIHGLRAMTKAWEDFRKKHAEQILFAINSALVIAGAALVTFGLANASVVAETIGSWVLLGAQALRTALTTAAAWAPVVAEFAAATVGVIFLGLALEDVYHFFKGDKASLIGKLVSLWTESVHSLGDAWNAVLGTIKEIANTLTGGMFDRLEKAKDYSDAQAVNFNQQKEGQGGHWEPLNNGKGRAWIPDAPTAAPTPSVPSVPIPSAGGGGFDFDAIFNITQQPGQDPQELAGAIRTQLDDWHRNKVRESMQAVK